jgi:hypothetical protein
VTSRRADPLLPLGTHGSLATAVGLHKLQNSHCWHVPVAAVVCRSESPLPPGNERAPLTGSILCSSPWSEERTAVGLCRDMGAPLNFQSPGDRASGLLEWVGRAACASSHAFPLSWSFGSPLQSVRGKLWHSNFISCRSWSHPDSHQPTLETGKPHFAA